MRAEPIDCFRPTRERAAEFSAMPYDVYDRSSVITHLRVHPRSFLAIDYPSSQFPADHDMYAPDVYERARELLNERVVDGTLVRDEHACYYVWRLKTETHEQTGLVCGVAVSDYEHGSIHQHEHIRTEKVADRTQHIRVTNAQTGPIFLAYRDNPAISTIIALTTAADPLYDFVDETGCRNTIWRIARSITIDALRMMFDQVSDAYIADGHHRAASAVAVCQERRATMKASGETPTGNEPWELFLAVLFPASQLEILPYNRVVSDLGRLSAENILDALREQGFLVTRADEVVEPTERGGYGIKLAGDWYQAQLKEPPSTTDPVSSLDVHVVQAKILSPILGITDPTTDARISFVGGAQAAQRAGEQAGTTGMAITLHATSLEELMDVSDAGLLMPPKSTWFEPKLLSGLFIRRI